MPSTEILQTQPAQQPGLRRLLPFAVLLLVVCAVSGSTVFYLKGPAAFFPQVLLLGAAGYLHAKILGAGSAGLTKNGVAFYSLLLATVVFGLHFGLAKWKGTGDAFAPLALACAFLLPYTMGEAFSSYLSLALPRWQPWFYNAEEAAQKSTTFLNSIPVRFRVEGTGHDRTVHALSFRAPVRMKLGLVFYHAVQQHNEAAGSAIRLLDLNGDAYGWLFFVGRAGGRRYLNPEAGLLENGVRENAVVTVRQLSLEEAEDLRPPGTAQNSV